MGEDKDSPVPSGDLESTETQLPGMIVLASDEYAKLWAWFAETNVQSHSNGPAKEPVRPLQAHR